MSVHHSSSHLGQSLELQGTGQNHMFLFCCDSEVTVLANPCPADHSLPAGMVIRTK